MSVLSVRHLSVKLKAKRGSVAPSKTLVDGISFDIQPSQVLALVGESGSGKSLSANGIMRLLAPNMQMSAQTLTLGKLDLLSLSEKQMNQIRGAHIAMIFQEPQSALNPVKTVGQQLKEALKLHKPESTAHFKPMMLKLLEEVGLNECEAKLGMYPHQLSGGQKQRLMIAMALAGEPELLIADEPTTALDVTTQKQILDLLLTLKQTRQLSILFITHDMSVVAYMADQVAVMQAGKIIETQAVHDFFNAPKHRYSQSLLASKTLSYSDLDRSLSSEVILEVKNLIVSYQTSSRSWFDRAQKPVVCDVSFKLNKGETLALVGESGSGKTTIGRAIIDLINRQSGQIIYAGKNLSELSAKQWRDYRKCIQIVFQDPFSSMNPRLTIKEILEEGIKSLLPQMNKSERSQTMNEFISKVGLSTDHLNRFAHEFSGGQRQRIAIARALVLKPQLLICDEPTSALDVATRHQILTLLQDLQKEMGLSYLFITHDLNLVAQFADKVAVMEKGKLVEQGTSSDVLNTPAHGYTQKLIGSALPLRTL